MTEKNAISKRPKRSKQQAASQNQPCDPCIATTSMPMPWAWISTVAGVAGEKEGQRNGKVHELQQEVMNLKALVEIMRKEIDALNALVRYLEQRKP